MKNIKLYPFLFIITTAAIVISFSAEAKNGCMKHLKSKTAYRVKSRTVSVRGSDINVLRERSLRDEESAQDIVQMDRLRGLIQSKVGAKLSKVKNVLYPMSGLDVVTPLRLFPNANLIMGVDDHEFFQDMDQRRLLSGRYRWPEILPQVMGGQGWAGGASLTNGELSSVHHFVIALLQSLARAVPNFRLRKVDVIFNKHSQDMFGRTTSDGLIEFDSGPNTAVRRYIHINRRIDELADEGWRDQWWYKLLRDHPIDALLAKGSNGALVLEDERYEDFEMVKAARTYLKGLLIHSERPVLLIEGTRPMGRGPEFSGGDPTFPEASAKHAFNLDTARINFSYGNRLYVWEFGL